MTEPRAYLNGRLLPRFEAALPLHDAGFVFGATVTDLCRTFRHRLYRWEDHLARFRRTCEAARINVSLSWDEIAVRAHEVVEGNAKLIDPMSDLALVLFATPGPVGYYLGSSTKANDEPTLGMHTFPLPFARYLPWIERGVLLRTPHTRAVPRECVDPRIKQRSRMHWWLAQAEVGADAQPLLLDLDGNVTETASANFLIVKDNTVISPPRDRILEGISLRVVEELCDRLGIPMVFRPLSLDDCCLADEAMLTSTGFCLVGVGQINDHSLAWPGPVMARLHDAWSTVVGLDIHQQIRAGGNQGGDGQ